MDTLEKDYFKLADILNNHMTFDVIDTTKYDFLAPTTLIPIIHYAKKYNRKILASDKTHDYIEMILKQENTSLTTFINADYRKFMKIPTTAKIRIKEDSYEKFVENLDHNYGGWWFQSYIVSELTNNIYEHAFNNHPIDLGINYAQIYPDLNEMDICIFDNGVSIPGNYTEHGVDYLDDCHAIELALSRNSTGHNNGSNDLLNERGNGIRTIINKLITENKGQALIASRNGYLYIKDKNEYKYGHLKAINGTLITLRLKQNSVSQFMDLAEFEFSNPYLYKGELER